MKTKDNMLKWNNTQNSKPQYYEDVEVRDKSGKRDIASLIYIDDINVTVWKDKNGLLFPVENYISWRKLNKRKLLIHEAMNKINHSKESFIDFVEDIFGFRKKHWILTCITEDLDIFYQNVFKTYEEAYTDMEKHYKELIKILGKSVVDQNFFKESATIVYDKEPRMFEFKITCVIK